jgi:NAD(P)-dependent dehydrogenase (short-subunit alcohol dehydrogenase family)
MDINGKVVLITGASEGIGAATAHAFADAGAKLVLAARSVGKLEALAVVLKNQGHTALAIPTDLRDQPAVAHMVAEALSHYGRIDVLVNNAGQKANGKVSEVDPEHFRQILELNILGTLHVIQAVVPVMRKGGGGLIVNISSMTSKMHIPGLGAYASTKAALNLLSDTLRGELQGENIRVVSVYPRITDTNFTKNSLGDPGGGWQARPAQAPGWTPPVVDSAEFVAQKILEVARAETPDKFMEG